MARGKKTSSEKIVEVLTAKLINPDLSTRDIEVETWVPYNTVSTILNTESEQVWTKEKKNELFDANLDIINIWTEKIRIAMRLLNPETIRDTKEYQTIIDTAFKQNQLIEWKATINVWGIGAILAEIQGINSK